MAQTESILLDIPLTYYGKQYGGVIRLDLVWGGEALQCHALLDEWPDSTFKMWTESIGKKVISLKISQFQDGWYIDDFRRYCAQNEECLKAAKEGEVRAMKGVAFTVLCLVLTAGLHRRYWRLRDEISLDAVPFNVETFDPKKQVANMENLMRYYRSIGFRNTEDYGSMDSTIAKIQNRCERKSIGKVVSVERPMARSRSRSPARALS